MRYVVYVKCNLDCIILIALFSYTLNVATIKVCYITVRMLSYVRDNSHKLKSGTF